MKNIIRKIRTEYGQRNKTDDTMCLTVFKRLDDGGCMGEKIYNLMDKISEVLERFMAVIVIIVVAVAIFALWEPFLEFLNHRMDTEAFLEFMSKLLSIVIGIEFFKMLCKPGTETVLEVLMFCIVRHTIVQETSAMENLLTIIGVAIILIVRKFLHSEWKHPHKKEKNMQTGKSIEKNGNN
ncbi:MAG: hypothetical protein HFG80_04495 [Eubacterium sp.]|nr:hypothetical protein [Eubacterium sp.]